MRDSYEHKDIATSYPGRGRHPDEGDNPVPKVHGTVSPKNRHPNAVLAATRPRRVAPDLKFGPLSLT